METLEKQELCLDILEKIIHLRLTFQATYESYKACDKTLAVLWEKGLATFLQEKYFAAILEKYTSLYENNCSVYASIPLKIPLHNTRVSFVSSSKMEIALDLRGYTPSAQVWCGMDRTKNEEKDFSFPSRSIPLPVLYLQNPALDTIKIPSYCYHKCLLQQYSFFALLYLLRYGKTKLMAATVPAVSKALYSAACNLAEEAFKKPVRNELEIPETEAGATKAWLKQMVKKVQALDLEAEKKKLNNQLFTSKFSQAIGQYLKLAKAIMPSLSPLPEALKKCSFIFGGEFSSFTLDLDIDSACEYTYRRFIGEKNEGFYLKLGNNSLSLLEYPHEEDGPYKGDSKRYKSPPPSFEEELLVVYMALTSLIDSHGELEAIKATLIEAEKQYLAYLKACSTINAAFKTQMLLTKI
jgi:hypothetical protein